MLYKLFSGLSIVLMLIVSGSFMTFSVLMFWYVITGTLRMLGVMT